MHISVLLAEAIESLKVEANQWYIDATFGRGGHTAAILEQGGKVIAFDVDQEAVAFGQQRFADEVAKKQLILIHENFDKLALETEHLHLKDGIKGILFDFGTSTEQLTSSERGFSFEGGGPLDMRMDQRLGVTAADLLGFMSERELVEVFFNYGGESFAKPIARHIKQWHVQNPGQKMTTPDLVQVVKKVKTKKEPLHPATKVFQALRILVNSELESIELALPQALTLLESHGRLVTIAFHEGEDRIVKKTFRSWENQAKGLQLDRRIVGPSEAELAANPRSRSARLRAFEKV